MPMKLARLMVMLGMLSPVHQLKIFWSIIKSVAIDVMCYFSRKQSPIKLFGKDKAMLVLPVTRRSNLNLPIMVASSRCQTPTPDCLSSRVSHTSRSLGYLRSSESFITRYVSTLRALSRIPVTLSILTRRRYDWLSTNTAGFVVQLFHLLLLYASKEEKASVTG